MIVGINKMGHLRSMQHTERQKKMECKEIHMKHRSQSKRKRKEEKKTFEHKTKTISKLNKVYIEKATCRQSRSRAGTLLDGSSSNSSQVYQNGKQMVKWRSTTIEYEPCECMRCQDWFLCYTQLHLSQFRIRWRATQAAYSMHQMNAYIVYTSFLRCHPSLIRLNKFDFLTDSK